MKPHRLRLSRQKGFRLSRTAVIVARPTPWGNPFKVGVHGTAERCVELYRILLSGHVCISQGAELVDAQIATKDFISRNLSKLRGKNLACWCRLDKPCHADVLLEVANPSAPLRAGR